MIFVTHDQEEAFSMSDRIMVMNNGNICQIDTPHKLLQEPASDFVKSFVVDNLRLKIDSFCGIIFGNVEDKNTIVND